MRVYFTRQVRHYEWYLSASGFGGGSSRYENKGRVVSLDPISFILSSLVKWVEKKFSESFLTTYSEKVQTTRSSLPESTPGSSSHKGTLFGVLHVCNGRSTNRSLETGFLLVGKSVNFVDVSPSFRLNWVEFE